MEAYIWKKGKIGKSPPTLGSSKQNLHFAFQTQYFIIKVLDLIQHFCVRDPDQLQK